MSEICGVGRLAVLQSRISLLGCESIETLGQLMSRLGDSPGFTLL